MEIAENNKFSIGFYFRTLTQMLGSPGQFFEAMPEGIGLKQPFLFLLMSSLFFTGASLTCVPDRHVRMGGILFSNAVLMPFITSSVAFLAMTMIMGRRVGFSRFFAVYAFSGGVTMLASWIPLFVWITEPWRWGLILMGLVKGCGLKWMQAVVILSVSIVVLMLFFWSLSPVLVYVKGVLN
ncbi:MAG: YIP1 family protein [Deltaproteobacteria bacterium]|nr:YIP1 family protein [Deltaproteobacteria bacterium]